MCLKLYSGTFSKNQVVEVARQDTTKWNSQSYGFEPLATSLFFVVL